MLIKPIHDCLIDRLTYKSMLANTCRWSAVLFQRHQLNLCCFRKLPKNNVFLPEWRVECQRGTSEEDRPIREVCQLPSNCALQRRVNIPSADHWPSLMLCLWTVEHRYEGGNMCLRRRPRTHCAAIAAHRNAQHAHFSVGGIMWIATNFCLAQQQWKHVNEMAEPTPAHVWGYLLSWELWLLSECLIQKYCIGFVEVCGTFCNEYFQGSKFLCRHVFKWNSDLLH